MNINFSPLRMLPSSLIIFFISHSVQAQNLFKEELGLPVRGISQRTTIKTFVEPGGTLALFEQDQPGCIFHWWMTYPWRQEGMMRDLQIRFYYDGAAQPAFEVSLAQYFSVLLDMEPYHYGNAALKILPRNALNCYFPIPYRKLRMEIVNTGERRTTIWFMADFHQYETAAELSSLRFRVIPNHAYPAGSSYLMADITGRGFLAGMTKGVRVLEEGDSWYHSGGDLLLLDGETDPHPIRGIGGEDVFNMSFGMWPVQTEWTGTLFKPENMSPRTEGFEIVMYRIFGPAPIWFDRSAIVRFGARPNDIESVIYAYVDPGKNQLLVTPATWQLAGPFPCENTDAFYSRQTWADGDIPSWPALHVADFGQYVTEQDTARFNIPVEAPVERGWLDFTRYFRGRKRTNEGTQPRNVCAYAVGELEVETTGNYDIHFAFDDQALLWIDGEEVFRGSHENGFATAVINHRLRSGPHAIKVKLSNDNNWQWRVWAFHFQLIAVP